MELWRDRLRREWAERFPEIDDKWTHWWIEGDGYCLAVIDGNNLPAAIDLVEDHWENYGHIKASSAKILDEDLIRKRA